MRAVVGVDGSRQQLGFFDSMRMENCSFYAATDGTQRCMPIEGYAIDLNYFSDSQCSQRLFAASVSCTAVPRYGLRVVTTCQSAFELHTLGSAIGTNQVFSGSSANCVAATAPTGYQLFASTGALAPAAFVQGNFVVEP